MQTTSKQTHNRKLVNKQAKPICKYHKIDKIDKSAGSWKPFSRSSNVQDQLDTNNNNKNVWLMAINEMCCFPNNFNLFSFFFHLRCCLVYVYNYYIVCKVEDRWKKIHTFPNSVLLHCFCLCHSHNHKTWITKENGICMTTDWRRQVQARRRRRCREGIPHHIPYYAYHIPAYTPLSSRIRAQYFRSDGRSILCSGFLSTQSEWNEMFGTRTESVSSPVALPGLSCLLSGLGIYRAHSLWRGWFVGEIRGGDVGRAIVRWR